MVKLLLFLFPLVGIAAGLGAGVMFPIQNFIKDTETTAAQECPPPGEAVDPDTPEYDTPSEFVKLSNQFIVPVLTNSNVESMVILTLSLEVADGSQQEIYRLEPKLRDSFLRVLFDHADIGGFSGNFLQRSSLEPLRGMLLKVGQAAAGPVLREVLVVDIVKQAI